MELSVAGGHMVRLQALAGSRIWCQRTAKYWKADPARGGLFCHSDSITRGIDLSTVLKYSNPYPDKKK